MRAVGDVRYLRGLVLVVLLLGRQKGRELPCELELRVLKSLPGHASARVSSCLPPPEEGFGSLQVLARAEEGKWLMGCASAEPPPGYPFVSHSAGGPRSPTRAVATALTVPATQAGGALSTASR